MAVPIVYICTFIILRIFQHAEDITWATTSTDKPIQIEAFALGQPPVKVNCTVESDTLRESIKGNIGVDQYANAGIEASREHEISGRNSTPPQ